ncbi:30S ribosomal protein S2 [bacterium]|nr:30S ribosomal protein S2 [bacterium]
MLPNVTLEDLLDAGAHFGHQTSRWHPKMGKFIFGHKNGIHLIDLKKTLFCLLEAYEVVRRTVSNNGTILFVGTKKQAKSIMKEEAERCGMYYVSERWLGGMLTNFRTIRSSVDRMKQIEKQREDGTFDMLTKKEVLELEKDYGRLFKVLGGISDMDRTPNLLFIVDAKKEEIPIREAKKLHIPIVAICDTNTDPEDIDYPIPANDDAIKSIKLIAGAIADAVRDGLSGSQLLERIDEESRIAESGEAKK